MTGRQPASNETGPATAGPVPSAVDVLGPLALPATWQERAEELEHLLGLLAEARGAAVVVYATAYTATAGTDTARTQAAKLASRDAQLLADQVHARLAAYRLLLEVARDAAPGDPARVILTERSAGGYGD